jgi:hypothetical protein
LGAELQRQELGVLLRRLLDVEAKPLSLSSDVLEQLGAVDAVAFGELLER